MFNSTRSGDYISAAAALTRSMDEGYGASRATTSNFSDIAKTAIRTKSEERQTAMNAANELAKQKNRLNTDLKLIKSDIKNQKEIANIKRPSQRFAGIVGAAGSLAGAYYLNQDRKEKLASEARQQERNDRYLSLLEQQANAPVSSWKDAWAEMGVTKPVRQEAELPDILQTNPNSSQSSTSTLVSDTGVSTAVGSTNTSTQSLSTAPNGSVSRQDVYSYLTNDRGLSKNKALGLMANIDRESSFRIAPPGGDNGNSFGMLQWNNNYGRADRMKQSVPDWQTNWKGQLDHALSQNQLPEYNQVTNEFLNTTFKTPQAAADFFMRKWEIPADKVGASRKHSGFLAGYNF